MKLGLIGLYLLVWSQICLADEYKMAMLGEYHGDEVSLEDGDKVLAFTKTRLEETIVNVEYVHDAVVDEKEDQKSGKKVSVSDEHIKNSAWLLIKGDLKPGVVESTYLDRYKCFPTEFEEIKKSPDSWQAEKVGKLPKDGLSCKFQLKGKEYTFKLTKYVDNSDYESGIDMNFEIIEPSGHTQIYMKVSDIAWLGDLNGDGKLDLVLDSNDHYNISVNFTLYLSTPEEKVSPKAVAHFMSVGC